MKEKDKELREKQWVADNLDNLRAVAVELLEATESVPVVLFDAEMGAGKTTLISALCEALGVKDDVGSPTFNIINEYQDGEGNPIYHFDFYRIEDPAELIDLGVEDYFDSGYRCFVEWPERGRRLIPENAAHIAIEVDADSKRIITLTLE